MPKGHALGITHTLVNVQQDPYGCACSIMSIKEFLKSLLSLGGVKDKDERMRRIRKPWKSKLAPVGRFLPKFPHMLSGGRSSVS